MKELTEYSGMGKLIDRTRDATLQEAFEGIFPKDDPANSRFSINFFTAIGLVIFVAMGLVDGRFLLIQSSFTLASPQTALVSFSFSWKVEIQQCCTSTRDLMKAAPLIERERRERK